MTEPAPDDIDSPEPTPRLHRKNAAEWAMYAALYPAYLAVRLFSFVSSRLRG